MSFKALRLALIAAVLFGSGAHWVLLQTAAWATMAWDNARELPITAALSRAFDGRHPCGMCHLVEDGAGNASDQAQRAAPAGVDWIAVPPLSLPPRPPEAVRGSDADETALSVASPPSTPPPRVRPA